MARRTKYNRVDITAEKRANIGHEEGFADIADEIGAYQFSAILDNATCPTCNALDSTYFKTGSPQLEELRPPLHSGCRCILVAVLKEEVTQFPVKYANFSPEQVASFLRNKI